MRRMKSLVAMAILAAVVGLSTPSAFADTKQPIYLGDRAATNTGIYLSDFAAQVTGIIFSATGIYLSDAANTGIYLSD